MKKEIRRMKQFVKFSNYFYKLFHSVFSFFSFFLRSDREIGKNPGIFFNREKS